MKLHTPEPFWLIKNGLINSYPSLNQNVECDVLVLGSGITGALVAEKCVSEGYKTVVADRRETGHGSTSATTSMLQYEIDTPLWKLIEMIGEEGAVASYKACYEAIDQLQNLSKKIGSKSGFAKKDSLYFAASKRHLKDLKKEFEARKKYGFEVEWLEADDIKSRFNLEKSFGGILSKQGASADAFLFSHELIDFSVKNGLRVFDKTEFKKIDYGEDFITVESEDGFKIKAKKIILCTGFETVEIIKENFVKLISTYAIAGEQMPDEYQKLAGTLFWNTADPYLYFRTTDDGRLLIGGEDDTFSNAVRRDIRLPRKTHKLENAVKNLLPDVRFKTDFAWAGTFGSTKDGLPYIGTHDGFPNAYFVLGFGGNGITFSMAGTEMVADFLKGKRNPLEQWFRFGR